MKSKLSAFLSSVHQFTTYFGIAMIVLLIMGVQHNLRVRRDSALQSASKEIKTYSKIFEEHVSRALRETDKTILLLRAAYEAAPGDFSLRSWVGSPLFRSELSVQYALIGRDGLMLESNVGPVNARIDLSDREHFKVHMNRNSDVLFVSKPVLGRASGKWSLQLTRPLRDHSGAFAGVIVASIDPYHFTRFYENIDIGQDGAITLVGFDGTIRARKGPGADVLGQSMAFRHHETAPTGIFMDDGVVDGVRRLLSYRIVQGFPLIVIAGVSERDIYTDLQKDKVVYLGGGSVVLVLIIIFIAAGVRNKYRLDRTLVALATERDNAESASQAKSSFLAVMSHEIRTPMNAVLGLTNTLLEEEVTPEQRNILRTIHDAGDSLLEILNDILDYSKLEAGELGLETIAFSPPELCDSAIAIIGPRASAKGLKISTNYDGNLPAAILGDAGRLRQVLLNLVSNAVKFTTSGGIVIGCRTISAEAGVAEIEWSVSDSGIGIAADRIGLLFNDYVQADCSINRRFGGSGLGLSICKRIIEAMNGSIEVRSTLGVGTTMSFRIKLPVGDATALNELTTEDSEAKLRAHIAGLGRPFRILIADDNSTNRLVAARMLKDLDVQIRTASDGTEAVSAATETEFDVILMDVRMPEMDGVEATRQLRSRGHTVPIIGFTANAFKEDVQTCRAAGMNGFVAKPARKPILLAAICDAVMASHAVVSLPQREKTGDAAVGDDAPLVERAVWQALGGELGDEALSEAFAVFVEETGQRIDALVTDDKREDRASLAREAHTIKGTAATFGLLRLSKHAAVLEQTAAGASLAEISTLVGGMKRAFAEAQSVLEAPLVEAA